MKFEIKSAEELAKMSTEELNSYMTAKIENDKKRLQDALAGKASVSDLEAIKVEMVQTQNELIHDIKNLREAFIEQGNYIKGLNAKKPSTGPKSLADVLAEPENAAHLQKIKNRETRDFLQLKGLFDESWNKAAGDMSLTGNVVTGQVPQAVRLPGFNDIPRRQVRLLDLVNRGSLAGNLVEWVYILNEDGAVATVAEAALKPQIDFDLSVGSQKVEKVAAWIKATTEMLSDVPQMESQIRNNLLSRLLLQVETQVYSGNNTPPNLNGIRTVASAFAAGNFATGIDNANQIDVLDVAIAKILVDQEGMANPNAILVHPEFLTQIGTLKVSATDNRYVNKLQEISQRGTFRGVPIVPTTLVSSGTYLVGDFSKAYVLDRETPTVLIGMEDRDFTNNHRTILAEWRGVCYVMHNDRSAFVAGTFATDQTALETT